MTITTERIQENLDLFLADRRPHMRYASYDFCFNYFQHHRETNRTADLTAGEGLQLSCLHLGFYLASWGMLRGSSVLLRRSARNFVPVIEVIADAPNHLWEIDVNTYSEATIAQLLGLARNLRLALPEGAQNSDILVTKILLGVFGSVPAFDTYFKKGFGVSTFVRSSLQRVKGFYEANTELIEGNRVRTLEFDSGEQSPRRYTRAKVIDMIFFIEGSRVSR